MLNKRCCGRGNTKSSVATFPLWSLQKQDSWVQRSENNIKDMTEVSIAFWLVHLKCGTLSKTRKIRFSVKVDFSSSLLM